MMKKLALLTAIVMALGVPFVSAGASELNVANPYDLPQDYSAYPVEDSPVISV